MEYFIICSVTVVACVFTLFSGFGLGTILMPVLAIFFPVDLAVALTAIVHFFNNLLKLSLFARHAAWRIVLQFGLMAVVASFVGAKMLIVLGAGHPLIEYTLGSRTCSVTPLKLVMAVLILLFAMLEFFPSLQNLSFQKKYLSLGGVLSGFFGGLSGNQGAFRSIFLIRCGLSKEGYIATGVVIACMVDVARLGVYIGHFERSGIRENLSLLLVVMACALTGTLAGNQFLKKVTVPFIQKFVSILLFVIALAMGFGLI